jgi:hypothetical protein
LGWMPSRSAMTMGGRSAKASTMAVFIFTQP